MVVHIVFFKLKNNTLDAHRLKSALEELRSKIEVIRAFEVGVDINRGERACDLSLYSEFDTLDDLKIYASHPSHLEVLDIVREVCEYTKVVDYER